MPLPLELPFDDAAVPEHPVANDNTESKGYDYSARDMDDCLPAMLGNAGCFY